MPTSNPNRRQFLRRSAFGSAVLLGGYAFGVEPRWISVEQHDLPVQKLPKHLVGKTAVQISDLHVGSRVDDSYLLTQFEYVQSLDPDFVFFTGDYLDNGSEWHLAKGQALLDRFPRGKLGNACVLGNHDFGSGRKQVQEFARNTQQLVESFQDHGLNLLIDQTVELDGLKIAGLRDYWNGRFQNTSARNVIQSVCDQAAIVLSHNPDTVDLPIWEDYQNWILCGHTHGGQCRFPGIGAPIVPVTNKRYVSGAYDIAGGHKLYINRGIGHTKRVRFMARPEITMFTLRSATT